jgi:hypothetical protein
MAFGILNQSKIKYKKSSYLDRGQILKGSRRQHEEMLVVSGCTQNTGWGALRHLSATLGGPLLQVEYRLRRGTLVTQNGMMGKL